VSKPPRIGIVTVSDRATAGTYEDRSGPAIAAYLDEVLLQPFETCYRLIPDEQPIIEATLIDLIDQQGCSLVLTTGGTGPAARDVTPEATLAVATRELPGFGELMRLRSLEQVATAILSRQTAATRGSALIINLPGKPQAIALCLDAVMPAVPYCIDLIGGARLETRTERLVAFRPKS
jgi:molybdopterin adenylyltransferase